MTDHTTLFMNTERRNSGFTLPLKATLSPPIVENSTAASSSSLTAHPQSSIPSVDPSSASSGEFFSSLGTSDDNHDHHNLYHQNHTGTHQPYHYHALARVSNILPKSRENNESPPGTPGVGSPMSSTDSLASLVERQHKSKISHPSHQLFRHQHKPSSSSIFNLLGTGRKNSSVPNVKSPLHNQIDPNATSRRLTPNHSNPMHIHSSPNVKESKKVYLEYDPVSKKRMLNTYEIVREIGRGEHGKVKLAREINSDVLVAIKILDRKGKPKLGKPLKPGSSEEEKIRKEIAIMKKINHPNVVQLKEVLDDTDSRKIYLVLEYMEKGEVKWQKSTGVPWLTLPEAMKVFRDVVLGLEYLHSQGIIHRDIKPANLLISKDGSVKISDFGVSFASSLNSGEEQDDYELAKTAGTPAFFAPEICKPLTNFTLEDGDATVNVPEHPKITYKIDIWALGVTLYCLLFGSMPFWATNEFELFKVICDKPLEFPTEYPNNHKWTEEDKFEAKNLLYKLLDKDPRKRWTIKEIKSHPFVLRNLTVEESRIFSTNQKACSEKIEVSKDEVMVAVTGIASKLRKGFAKALKFATGLNSGKHSPARPFSPSGSVFTENSTTSLNKPPHSRTNSAGIDRNHLFLEDLSRSSSTLINKSKNMLAAASSNISSKLVPIHSAPTNESRSRVKSIESSTETRATVEGDLFLNKGSAHNSLSHIINHDRKRSSASSAAPTPEGYTTSNDSSFSKVGSTIVSLPVNASFASLDSVYLDNYATTYYTEVRDARAAIPRSNMDPPNIPIPGHNSIDGGSADKGAVKVRKEEVISPIFKKMSGFSLNRSTEPKEDDGLAPHEPVTFDLDSDSGSDDDDDCDSSGSEASTFDGSGYRLEENYDDRIVFGRQQSSDQVSAFSVPSILVNDLATNMTSMKKGNAVAPEMKRSSKPAEIGQSPSPVKLPINGRPKYSFFENSESEEASDSGQDSEFNEDQEVGYEICRSEDDKEHSSSDSEPEELFLSFGNRGRTNTITTSTVPRPTSEPAREPDIPIFDNAKLTRLHSNTDRVSSPLCKNAPHTPVSTINAHILPRSFQASDYVNHYHKVLPSVPYHIDSAFDDSNETSSRDLRSRSNSITVGILESYNNRSKSEPTGTQQ